MFEILLAVGIVLILVIALVIFRISVLAGVIKGSDKKWVSDSNRVNAVLLVLFVLAGLILFFWYSFAYYDEYTLPVASEHGVLIDRMFWITTAVTMVVFVITQLILFIAPYLFQHRENRRASFYHDNTKLEIAWTALPAVVLTGLVLYGLFVWNSITSKAPEEAEVVEIMGYQFAWAVRYPGQDKKLGDFDYLKIDATNVMGIDFDDNAAHDDFTPREIHLPKGKPVQFKIRARDVLHSVFAPHFRMKMDAVPGLPTSFWFVPTKTTEEMREKLGNPDFNYEIACTEVCGRGHFSMRILVVVDEPEDYEAWYASQQTWVDQNESYFTSGPGKSSKLADLVSVKDN